MRLFFIYYLFEEMTEMELNMNIPNIDYFVKSPKSRCTERHVKLRFPELYKELLKYDDCSKFTERLYRYYHNIQNNPTCSICGKKLRFWNFIDGYSTYCSYKCMYKSQDRQDNYKKTCIEKYGVENASQCETIKEKRKETTRKHFGVDCSLSSSIVREKGKKTMMKKYGVENASQCETIKEKRKETTRKHFGVDYSLSSSIVREKGRKTILKKYNGENIYNVIYRIKKKNHTLASSLIEKEFDSWLTNNNIPHIWHHKSDNYPFVCDFYFPDKDIYLEIQGHWGHGGHPFNPNNDHDINLLNKWISKNTKHYNNALEVWTIRDPLKRQWAKEHGLNWHEIFTIKLDDLISWYNSVN